MHSSRFFRVKPIARFPEAVQFPTVLTVLNDIVCVSEISFNDLEGVRVMETINMQCKSISQIH